MDVIRVLCAGAYGMLKNPGLLAMELDAPAKEQVLQLLQGPWRHVDVVADLQFLPRVVVAEKS